MALSAIFSALCNAVPFYTLSSHLGLEAGSDIHQGWILIAAASFLTFVDFRQLITARSMGWLLSRALLRWVWVVLAVVLSLLFLVRNQTEIDLTRSLVPRWAIIALILQMLCLMLCRRGIYWINNLADNRHKAVFFGMGPQAHTLYLRLRRSPILGIEVMGYYASQPVDSRITAEGPVPPYLGSNENAWPHIKNATYDMVFIQPYGYYDQQLSAQMFEQLYDSTANIYMLPETRWADDVVTLTSNEIAGVSLLSIHATPIMGFARVFKRIMDLVLGGIALLLLSPVMLAVAIAVRLDSPGPILFRQNRYGERGQPVPVYKFRSMYVDKDTATLRQASRGDPRVTRVGRILRRTSLDELPQLFNVLLGTMSLVGPRPHADAHNELYRRQISGYMLRHSIKPGITGWAQVNGLRGETDTLEKMQRRIEYDRYYIQYWSLSLDIRILFLTIWTVIRGDNAY